MGPTPRPDRYGRRERFEPEPLHLPLEAPEPVDDDRREPERDRTGSHVIVIDLA